MALNDKAVLTPAVGYVFTNRTLGAVRPTPAELDGLDPETFGCQVLTLKVTGTPTSYVLTVAGESTSSIPLAAGPDAVQAALEALPAVGPGNTLVTGTNAGTAEGLEITVAGALAGKSLTITGSGTGGTTPTVVVTVKTALNGWLNLGHTSRDDLPEFGFDGGETTTKGSWQKKRLREIADGDPVADSVTVALEQWDLDTLELYFGENATPSTPGEFGVSGEFTPVERSLLIIIVDGDVRLGFYSPKASVRRDEAINLPVDDLSSLPVKATFLNLGSRPLYNWISEALF